MYLEKLPRCISTFFPPSELQDPHGEALTSTARPGAGSHLWKLPFLVILDFLPRICQLLSWRRSKHPTPVLVELQTERATHWEGTRGYFPLNFACESSWEQWAWIFPISFPPLQSQSP